MNEKYEILRKLLGKNQEVLDFITVDFLLNNEHDIIKSLQQSRELIIYRMLEVKKLWEKRLIQ